MHHGARQQALWFMYEPVLMSKKSFDKLDKKQQDVLIEAGKKAQKYYEDRADAVNAEKIKAYRDHRAKVDTLTDAEYDAWLDVAKKSSSAPFRQGSARRQKLIDAALSVK